MRRHVTLLLALLAMLLLTACGERGAYSGTLVLEGPHTYTSGETIQGGMLIADGQVFFEQGSEVLGSVYILGGTVRLDGDVTGDVSIIGGTLSIGRSALIEGALNVGGGTVSRADGATIGGQVNTGTGIMLPNLPEPEPRPASSWLLDIVIQSLVLLPLALVLVHFAPRHVGRVRQVVGGYPLVAGALGFLALNVFVALFVLMAFTIILIPVTVLGLGLMLISVLYGEIALSLILGGWVARRLGWQMAITTQAALGTLLFVLLSNLIGRIPLVGALIIILAFAVGFGAVLLTRFGFTQYVPPPETMGPEAAAQTHKGT